MNVASVESPVETFVISIDEGKEGKGSLAMTWENTRASVPVAVH